MCRFLAAKRANAIQGPTDSPKEALTPRLLSELSSVFNLVWGIDWGILYTGNNFVAERVGPTYFNIGFNSPPYDLGSRIFFAFFFLGSPIRNGWVEYLRKRDTA